MGGVDAFVAEGGAELEDAVEAAEDEALEPELGRDAKGQRLGLGTGTGIGTGIGTGTTPTAGPKSLPSLSTLMPRPRLRSGPRPEQWQQSPASWT